MKLKSFRIQNYKSIIDSRECRISEIDNITVLAGQNESGKSSILQALRDYHAGELSQEAIRIDNEIPEITCTYSIEQDDYDVMVSNLKDYVELPDTLEKYIRGLKEISFTKRFEDLEDPLTNLNAEVVQEIELLKAKEVERLNKALEKVTKENLIAVTTDLVEEEGEDIEEDENEEETEDENTDEEEENDDNDNETEEVHTVNSEEFIWDITFALDELRPTMIFFDDFCDLLPDKILVSDLIKQNSSANGYQAVKNIETILGDDLTKLDKLGDAQLKRAQTTYDKILTAKFNEKWRQKISEEDQANIYVQYNQGKAADSSYLTFFIETKRGEFLPPRQRSQGFRWFLSFYLHLKAESERNKSLIILFDEPGLFLHSRAQNDMINVFEELAAKNQIIYSTHSPYLIDTSKLYRIKLVLNSKENGTTIEKITTPKVKDQKDALKPIIDAMGLDVAHNFTVAKKKNVILEGISDFYYLQAFRKLLGKNNEFSFVPAMGYGNVHLLMELCIGWGLEWLIIFDDKGVVKEYNKIRKTFFENDDNQAKSKILKLTGFDGIEELFDDSDMDKVLPEAEMQNGTKKAQMIYENGGKELVARLFLEKVQNNKIKKSSFSANTLKNFEMIFEFIYTAFNLKKDN